MLLPPSKTNLGPVDLQTRRVILCVNQPAWQNLELLPVVEVFHSPGVFIGKEEKRRSRKRSCKFTTFVPVSHHGKMSCCPDGSRRRTSLRNLKHDWMRVKSCFPFLAAEDKCNGGGLNGPCLRSVTRSRDHRAFPCRWAQRTR